MNFASIFSEVVKVVVSLGEEVAPGVVGPADALVVDALKLVKAIAHPNTLAYKAATAGLAALGS